MSKEKRFITVHTESSSFTTYKIIVDTETGVSYLSVASGYGFAITPLLDADGRPGIAQNIVR